MVLIPVGPGLSLVPIRLDHLPAARRRSCRCPALAPGDHQCGVQQSCRPTNLNQQVVGVVPVPVGPGLSLVPIRLDHLPAARRRSCRCPALAPGDHQCGVQQSCRPTNLNQQVIARRLWRVLVGSLERYYSTCNLPVSRLAISLSIRWLPRPTYRANTADRQPLTHTRAVQAATWTAPTITSHPYHVRRLPSSFSFSTRCLSSSRAKRLMKCA